MIKTTESIQAPSLLEADLQRLQRFYGPNWFKCPWVNCLYYYEGFSTADQRQQHVDKHDRPFLCIVVGCHMELFGCATKDKLDKHLFKFHGLYVLDETGDAEFPEPLKEKTSNKGKNAAMFQCHLCPKTFTRNYNLQSHLRNQEGIKPYECSICGDRFTRKPECDRHERGHGDKNFVCGGPLKDGSTWGCNAAFCRADKLADHIRTKTGQNCMRPLLLEKLQEGGGGDGDGNVFTDRVGEDTDALLAAGKLLPSFGEFKQLCGLDKSIGGLGPKGTSPSEGHDKASN